MCTFLFFNSLLEHSSSLDGFSLRKYLSKPALWAISAKSLGFLQTGHESAPAPASATIIYQGGEEKIFQLQEKYIHFAVRGYVIIRGIHFLAKVWILQSAPNM